MIVAANEGWSALTLERIAAELLVPVQEARSVCPTVHSIIEALINQVDRTALDESAHFQDEDTVRDRLFALLMARLDALQVYKPAMQKLPPCLSNRPLFVFSHLPRLMTSMAFMLEVAGVPPSGPMGAIRTKGLALVYLAAFRVWLRDDTENQAATMATMDKGLSRAEMLALQLSPKRARS